MPSVSYDGQSFQVNGRRVWLCGASVPYALLPASEWRAAIAAVREAGFNTLETFAPWSLHEPRPGRFEFSGDLDIRRFLELCGEAGLRVLLRVGPSIGSAIDGGGLPPWLSEIPGMAIRQASEPFLERVGLYFHRLIEPLAELQATRPQPGGRDGGPLFLVQVEHAWHCSNEEQGRRYLQELVRYVRECGITLPLLSANDLWQDVEGTIETWTGSSDLLVNLRQLRAVQSHAPRIVSAFRAAETETWGNPTAPMSRDTVLVKLAQACAAGGQVMITPFHPGAYLGFLGGRLAGDPSRYATTRGAADAPLDAAGTRGEKYHAIKRLASFATSFGHVLAELDPDYHPIAVDVESTMSDRRDHPRLAVVPLEGPQGRAVFVFCGEGHPREVTLLLESGIRMPVHLGDQPVGWFLLDVDLLGNGRLDFSNLCPHLLVDRTILVVQGPAKAPAYLSINGGPLEAVVPTGTGKPVVADHKGITVVICNQQQVDATYTDGEHVYVGCEGFDAAGHPVPAAGFAKVWKIAKGGAMTAVAGATAPRTATAPTLAKWSAASAAAFASGHSQRFATLDGPASLVGCGAPLGYGWYRVRTKGAGKKRSLHLAEGGDRLHLYVDGKFDRIVGTGPGALPAPFDVKLAGGESTLVFLADNLGRFAEGHDAGERKGMPGPIYEVTPLKGVRMRAVEATPADPFKLRGFIAQRASGQAGPTMQAQWSFTHRRKSSLLVTMRGLRWPGTLLINDQPLAYYAGATGGLSLVVLLDPAVTKGFRAGANNLRFSPDPPLAGAAENEDVSKALLIHEVVRDLGADAQWSFARWETPPLRAFSAGEKPSRGVPCWWRSTFECRGGVATSLWLTTGSLSKGAALVNGRVVGRYFNAGPTGKAVGPNAPLWIPPSWLNAEGENELVIFDEHGFAPTGVKLATKPG